MDPNCFEGLYQDAGTTPCKTSLGLAWNESYQNFCCSSLESDSLETVCSGSTRLKENESKVNDSDFDNNLICNLMYWCVTVCIKIQS